MGNKKCISGMETDVMTLLKLLKHNSVKPQVRNGNLWTTNLYYTSISQQHSKPLQMVYSHFLENLYS